MARLKKPVDYIAELQSSSDRNKRRIGEQLKMAYATWTKTLKTEDFLKFLELIQRNKEKIGAAQFFGKFRAFSFEEYVYHVLKTRVRIPKSLNVFWGRRCKVSAGKNGVYGIEADIAIGVEDNAFIKPEIVVDAKVELDASRLKTALASFMLVKAYNRKTRCFLVYIKREVDAALLKLARKWIDGIFEFNAEEKEVKKFIVAVQEALLQKL